MLHAGLGAKYRFERGDGCSPRCIEGQPVFLPGQEQIGRCGRFGGRLRLPGHGHDCFPLLLANDHACQVYRGQDPAKQRNVPDGKRQAAYRKPGIGDHLDRLPEVELIRRDQERKGSDAARRGGHDITGARQVDAP